MADISKINPNGDIYDIKDATARAGLNLKADKVSNATANNFAGLDSNGNLTDSGKKASDFMASDGVIANPQGTVTGTLTKLGIGSDIYEIQGGSGGEYRLLTGTLLANAWSNNTQTVTIQGISSTTNGVIGLLDSATSAQIESAKNSEINVTTLGTNSVSFVCKNVPTVDIPFGVLIGGGGSGTSDYTELENKPQINGNILTGDSTGADLGLADANDAYLVNDTIDDVAFEDTDKIPFYDDSASVKKNSTWSNIKSRIKTFLDSYYNRTEVGYAGTASSSDVRRQYIKYYFGSSGETSWNVDGSEYFEQTINAQANTDTTFTFSSTKLTYASVLDIFAGCKTADYAIPTLKSKTLSVSGSTGTLTLVYNVPTAYALTVRVYIRG